jgi:cytochrome c-type biogenesis protein CcmE
MSEEVQGPEDEERSGLPIWVPIAGVFVLLAAGVVFLLFGSDTSEVFVYSKLLDDVMQNPDEHRGRQLRVEGELRQGSIQFREDPCEWRFVLEKGEEEMSVAYPQCVVPDTFRDGMGISVTVRGELQDDNTFLANEVVPRCPSKYEMQQRQENGEVMPHAEEAPGTTGPTT